MTADAPRMPLRAAPEERIRLRVGTWPVAPGQSVWATCRVRGKDGSATELVRKGRWLCNEGPNSIWEIELGRFRRGDSVEYTVLGSDAEGGDCSSEQFAFSVGPKLLLALLWHQHQPLYAPHHAGPGPAILRQPWARLHALRDYLGMAALAAEQPALHLTINLSPVLLLQLDGYVAHTMTDAALELTRKPAEQLDAEERRQLLASFFDAHWHNQIERHPRYAELFARHAAEKPFSAQDLRDLQMWFNLAWFSSELRRGELRLPTGKVASVRRFVEQGAGFSHQDVLEMIAEQEAVMEAVVPLHAELQRRGQIEVSTTPKYHPILPLLVDTDRATLDRAGTWLPERFAHPEDAHAQVRAAVADYTRRFGVPPRGMWPAEGAVADFVVPIFAEHGVRWLASDRGVLARSGKWGYAVDDPDVACQPYRAEAAGTELTVFFRDTQLADAIGFSYQHYADPARAARHWLTDLKERLASRVSGEDRVVTVALDGENPWGGYVDDGRSFLRALYAECVAEPQIETVTFSEYLDGNAARDLAPHPVAGLERVHELFNGSWADESGSAPGVDLGTWIGEEEENRAWNLLGALRRALSDAGLTPEAAPEAFEALYAAEGSDWFWWYGTDQDSGHDDEFDALFRAHVMAAYRLAGLSVPAEVRRRIVPRSVPWSFAEKAHEMPAESRLHVRTNCPGVLRYRVDDGGERRQTLLPTGGAMAGVQRFETVMGPMPSGARVLAFRFECGRPGCVSETCAQGEQRVVVLPASSRSPDLQQ
ncbi:MAG: glycoside hydrolase [Myxococcales bacterium]|nr:glycoside hydrolase [Myxococcales bacterium]